MMVMLLLLMATLGASLGVFFFVQELYFCQSIRDAF
jgi:hypothetical protein